MTPRALQMIQRVLVAAVTVVLALVVISAFIKVIAPPDAAVALPTTTRPATTTTTTEPPVHTVPPPSVTTTPDPVDGGRCEETPPNQPDMTVLRVFYPCGTGTVTRTRFVYREVPPTRQVMTATFAQLTKGIDSTESDLGFRTPLPADASSAFLGASINGDRVLLEFTEGIFPEGVDTPEGMQIFLSTLNANVFQFASISEAEYRVGGSCDAFWSHFGSKCQIVTRSEWGSQVADG